MSRPYSFINFNANVQIPLYQDRPNPNTKPQKDPSNTSIAREPQQDFIITDDAIETKKTKRVILKSREKFPSDFFNEGQGRSAQGRRQNTSPDKDTSLRPRRANSSAVDSTLPSGTPKFSGNLPIFFNKAYFNRGNLSDAKEQNTWSIIPIEENDALNANSDMHKLQVNKVTRSRSLMEPSGSPENPLGQDPLDQLPARHSIRPISEYKQSPDVKLRVVRHQSLQKPRANNFGEVRMVRQKSDPKIFNDNSISTDVSSKGPSREAPIQIDSDKPFRNKTPPETSLFHLPVIKKETAKNEALRNRPRKSDSLETSYVAGYQEGALDVPRSALLHKEALPLYNPVVEYNKRVQSQGATPGIDKPQRHPSPFGREMKPVDDLLKGTQKAFSAKSIAQFQALLGRPFNINTANKRLIQGKENSFVVRQQREMRESRTIKNRIKSSCEPREVSNKETVEENRPTTSQEQQQKIETDFDDTNMVKENKELYEFSFSKNFYKDKPSSAAVPNVSTFGRDSKDNIERGQFRMPSNMSNRSDKEYLRAKNTTFVNSNVKKKFSLARIKQVQG